MESILKSCDTCCGTDGNGNGIGVVAGQKAGLGAHRRLPTYKAVSRLLVRYGTVMDMSILKVKFSGFCVNSGLQCGKSVHLLYV